MRLDCRGWGCFLWKRGMDSALQTTIILLSICSLHVAAYPNGKVEVACGTMEPNHGASPQTSAAPYSLVVSNTTYGNGQSITVTLNNTSQGIPFEGFLIQARAVGGHKPLGTFQVSDSAAQTLTCNTDAVSHTDSNLKSNIQVTWTAPDVLTGNVMFRATVVKSKKTFWTNVVSTALIYNNKVSNTTTTALNGHTVTISNTTCGTQKFCLSNPANCSPDNGSCLFMSSVPSSNGFVFEMSGSTTGYLAIAFSDDQLMGNDDIYICTRNSSGNILVQRAFSTGHVTPQARNMVSALMLIAWMTTGTVGMLTARYMKHAANKLFIGKALWFLIHVCLMCLTVIFTIIAFIMVFANDTGAHPVLGCIVMILSFLQPFGALLRPDPNHKRRFIFNWVHGLNALLIKVLAVAAIFLGLQLVDISPSQWMPKVMGGFYGWEVLFYIILEINARSKISPKSSLMAKCRIILQIYALHFLITIGQVILIPLEGGKILI
uniref:Ferric-chelate reductase 1 n=1 Tax=Xenopus tropicalis TaxID=8364 RepID=A0A803K1Z3_XENTR